MSFRGGSMYVRGGGVRRKRRKRKRGSGLIGSDPRTWAPRGSGFGRARVRPFLGGLSYLAGRKRGSGMSFAGSGMSWSGAGIHGKRLIRRVGGGRRRI